MGLKAAKDSTGPERVAEKQQLSPQNRIFTPQLRVGGVKKGFSLANYCPTTG